MKALLSKSVFCMNFFFLNERNEDESEQITHKNEMDYFFVSLARLHLRHSNILFVGVFHFKLALTVLLCCTWCEANSIGIRHQYSYICQIHVHKMIDLFNM